MKAAFGSPASIYAIDKRGAELCTAMSVSGFAFDAQRARGFLASLQTAEDAARARLNEAIGREVSALSVKDLGRAFFAKPPFGLGAPVFFRSQLTGNPSLGVDAMRAYAACASETLRAAALAVLDVRRARKVRSTYVARPLRDVEATGDGRIHPTWANCGPVSGRWACKDPNLMNLPRTVNDPTAAEGGIRSLYKARRGFVLVGYDKSQLEMRVAAYASGDKAMIAACESRDLHSGNAIIIFGGAFPAERYFALKAQQKKAEKRAAPPLTAEEETEFAVLEGLRTLAKSAGFAVCYMATAETVYTRIVADGKGHLLPNGIRSVDAMLSKLQRGFATYFGWQESRRLEAIRTGYTDEPVTGRRRWLGHDPSPTECANHPIQGGAAGIMNLELPRIVDRMAADVPSADLVAMVHDAAYFEVPAKDAAIDAAQRIIREESEHEVLLHSSGLKAKFPSDIKVTERLAA